MSFGLRRKKEKIQPVDTVPIDEIREIRTLTGPLLRAVAWAAFLLGCFHLYTGYFGAFTSMSQRAGHWVVLSTLAFLLYPGRKGARAVTWGDSLWAGAAALTGIYILLNWSRIADDAGITNEADILVGAIAVVVVIEATRRVIGLALALLGSLFLLYAYFGSMIPGALGHRGYSLERLISFMYATTEGIYGIPLDVSAKYVALFIIFGAVLDKFGGGKFFVEMAFALTDRTRGGPAKAAVVSSALMGTVSGSAVANVVTTGTFTIPLMKRTGYQPHVAGAVEAVASTGGQIMPPVMGAAAFMMAEIIGIEYVKIMAAAVLPAILYFLSIFIIVDLEAAKWNIQAQGADDRREAFIQLMKKRSYLILPLVLLISLILKGFSPMKSVVLSIFCILCLDLVFHRRPKELVLNLFKGIETAMRNAISVATACACSGIIVGVISLTGLGLKFSSLMLTFSSHSIWLTLCLTMLASLILGCGLPTTAAYIVLATLAVPIVVKMGVPILSAHLFVFYFGIISTITPPVALSAYAAGALAGANPHKVGWTAFKFGIVAFIIPYMWIANPALLLSGSPWMILQVIFTSVIGVGALAIGIQKFALVPCTRIEQILAIASGLLLIDPGWLTDILGAVTISSFILLHTWNKRSRKTPIQSPASLWVKGDPPAGHVSPAISRRGQISLDE